MMLPVRGAGDSGNETVLAAFGVGPTELLGHGGEASIYALDSDRVLRVLHSGGDIKQLRRNQALLGDLKASAVPFQLPEIFEIGEIDSRTYAIERRLPGCSLAELLGTIEGAERDHLIEAYLEAAGALGNLQPEGWSHYGELTASQPVRAETWNEFLAVRAAQSFAAAGPPWDQIDAGGLAPYPPGTARPA